MDLSGPRLPDLEPLSPFRISDGIGTAQHLAFSPLIIQHKNHNYSRVVYSTNNDREAELKNGWINSDLPNRKWQCEIYHRKALPFHRLCTYAEYGERCWALNGKEFKHIIADEYDRIYVDYLQPDLDIWSARLAMEGSVESLTLTRDVQLTDDPGFDGYSTISPDGQWAVYTSMRTGDPELWLMNATDGSGKRQITYRKGFDGMASFSEDGLFIAFISISTGDEQRFSYLLRHNIMDNRNSSIFIIQFPNLNNTILTYSLAKEIRIEWPKNESKSLFAFRNPKFVGKFLLFEATIDDESHDSKLFKCEPKLENFATEYIRCTSLLQITCVDNAYRDLVVHPNGNSAYWFSNQERQRALIVMPSMLEQAMAFPMMLYQGNLALLKGEELPITESDKQEKINFLDESEQQCLLEDYGINENTDSDEFVPKKLNVLQNVRQLTSQNDGDYLFVRPKFGPHEQTIIFESVKVRDIRKQRMLYQLAFRRMGFKIYTAKNSNYFLLNMDSNVSASNVFVSDHQYSSNLIYTVTFLNSTGNVITENKSIYHCNQHGITFQKLCGGEYKNKNFCDSAVLSPHLRSMYFVASINNSDYQIWQMELKESIINSLFTRMAGRFLPDPDQSKWRQLTNHSGYKFDLTISKDGRRIAYATKTAQGSEIYLLEWNVATEKWAETRNLTNLGALSRSPEFLADGQHILFNSNFKYLDDKYDQSQMLSDIFVLSINGCRISRLISNPNGFDAFPAINSDGSLLIWSSNRNFSKNENKFASVKPTNIFIAFLNL